MYLEDPIANAASEGVFDDQHGWCLIDEYGSKYFTDYFDQEIDENAEYIKINRTKYSIDFVAWDDLDEYLKIVSESHYPKEKDEDYLRGYLDAIIGRDSWEKAEPELA